MLTAIRPMAEAAERGATLPEIVAARRRDRDGDARDAAGAPRSRRRRCRRGGPRRDRARDRRRVSGEALPEAPERQEEIGIDAIHQELSKYRYCTVFVVEGDDLDLDALESQLEEFGDSLLVVGDRTALKVHVHTDDPGRALSLGVARGTIGGIEIANMHEQTHQREERLLHVVPAGRSRPRSSPSPSGAGNRALFESAGAQSSTAARR